MAVRTLLLLLALLPSGPLLGGPPDRKPAPERDVKQDPKWVGTVHDAIDRGVAWLISKQSSTGKFPAYEDVRGDVYELGMHALATLAVIKGGAPLDGEPVQKALKVLHTLYDRHGGNLRTYELGVTAMALEAKYFAVAPRTKKKGRGGKQIKFEQEDLQLAQRIALWLQAKQQRDGFWRYPDGGSDLSNTQYAALGLWACQRLGVPIDAGVIQRLLERTMEMQQPEGVRVPFITDPKNHRKPGVESKSGTYIRARGWRYMPDETVIENGQPRRIVWPYSGSMTTAGIAALAIGREILGKEDPWLAKNDSRLRLSMWEGLAWLQKNWEIRDNPGQNGNWPFYWLYGLERVGRICGVEYIGAHDWYVEGATHLLGDQRDDGSWPKAQRMHLPGEQNERWWSDQVDTAFAVLFLALSSPELRIPPPAITGTGD